MSKIQRYTAPVTVGGRTYTPAELEARDRAAFRAKDLHASGYTPKPQDLDGAPHIDNWTAVEHVGDDGERFTCLYGIVTGHPDRLFPHEGRTSLIIAMDEQAGWARTYSRYYRLGERALTDEDEPPAGMKM